jgi:hypothetical protein
MDKLINYYFNLISTKSLQESIATDLRDIKSNWTIKYEEEEIEEEVNKIEEPDILTNDDLDFYKQIDDILAKANQSISKDISKTSKKSIIVEQPKITSATNQNFKKCKSSFTTAKPKPAIQPTYLKAPYKTLTTTIKPPTGIKPINQLNKKSLSIDNLSIKKSESEQIREQTSIAADMVINKKTTEKKLIIKYKPVSFKEMAMNLYLSPKLEYLTVKSTEIALKLKNKKRQSSAKQSFLNKLNKNFCNNDEQTNPFRIEIIYKKTRHLLLTQLYQMDSNSKLLYFLKLKILMAYFESFNENIRHQIPKEILSSCNHNNKLDENSNNLDLNLFDLNLNNSTFPIQYENEVQLTRLNDLKCDLFELEFKILLFNFLKTNILNANNKSFENIEFLKLVYSFISDDNKKVIIAS